MHVRTQLLLRPPSTGRSLSHEEWPRKGREESRGAPVHRSSHVSPQLPRSTTPAKRKICPVEPVTHRLMGGRKTLFLKARVK